MVEAGSLKQFIRAHIIGGGLNPELSSTVGEENILIAEEVLKSYHIAVLTRDTGGHTGRKLVFNNESGKILVYKGISVRRDDWYR
jgi:chemotaxis protein CheD